MMSFYDQLYGSLELYSRYMATREDGWAYRDMYGRKRKHLGSPESIIAFLYPVDLINAMEKQLALAEETDMTAKVQTRLALVAGSSTTSKASSRTFIFTTPVRSRPIPHRSIGS